MKVLICGSRHFTDYPKFCLEIDNQSEKNDFDNKQPITIISGEARGTDTLAKQYAEECGWNYDGYPADWNTYGNRAGPIRNRQMLVEGKPDLVIAFLGRVATQEFESGLSDSKYSRGTKNMIDQATKAGVPVEIIDVC